jgi:N-acetylmuramoyl-L-alanine amidase
VGFKQGARPLLSTELADNKLVSKTNIRRIGFVNSCEKFGGAVLLALLVAGCEATREAPPRRAATTATPAGRNPLFKPQELPGLAPRIEPAPLPSLTVVPEDSAIAPAAPIVAPELTLDIPQTATGALATAVLQPLSSNSPPISRSLSKPNGSSPGWPTNWVNGWIPLEHWGSYNGLGKPMHPPSRLSPMYEFHTTNGILALKIGSRLALFNGLECWLGYSPLLIKGLPCIHWLDAQKILQPWINSFNAPIKNGRTIVLDPGHGGKDSGARSLINSTPEKDYTLDCALRLRTLLLAKGWKVLLTRTNDLEISLPDRVAVADRANADLFLSLHFNSGLPNRELAGIETYCLTPSGLPSSLTRDYEDNLRQTFPNNAYDEQNFLVAYRLHRQLLQSLNATDRGVRRARFMGVLRAQNRPAVLIEAGYLSNIRDAGRIASPDYRQKLAEGIAKALEE